MVLPALRLRADIGLLRQPIEDRGLALADNDRRDLLVQPPGDGAQQRRLPLAVAGGLLLVLASLGPVAAQAAEELEHLRRKDPEAYQELEAEARAALADDKRLALLRRAGMLSQGKSGEYDKFRNRIMFPIHDRRGRVIAFGGRALGDDGPKYLNSPETELFHKGRELYGLYEARQALRHIDRLVVVEGYMDVVALARNGIDRAGLLKNPAPDWTPTWLTYFGVKDAAAAATRAEELGGQILVPVSPEVREGTMAVVKDPTGALLVLQNLTE